MENDDDEAAPDNGEAVIKASHKHQAGVQAAVEEPLTQSS
jgi:hypothetical protein